jgi:hypothetical protein
MWNDKTKKDEKYALGEIINTPTGQGVISSLEENPVTNTRRIEVYFEKRGKVWDPEAFEWFPPEQVTK